ncbi:hypothetical protein JRO89_XS05G0033000 [Xanthoceras sorbifolium]|uniref:Uncharacterized protein n=1 Tax=Xanthoceras sorbifolium TaxID=99658 RepID=A0ABQ8I068_9ROSI|nr:hypothetical protein JRO89_XS05G0033000 [Xanthoceras sorbifolium]
MSSSGGFDSVTDHLQPHVALLPSAGMGHPTPFLHFAASLVHNHCLVTLITTHPSHLPSLSLSLASSLLSLIRTALSKKQIKELGIGLVSSGCRFLWVKGKKVDKEDEESLEKLLGNELMEKIKGQGLVIKNWVDQDEILSHRAVGGFVNYGGWNSIVEATWHGVSVIVWPQFGYQKINAEVVGGSGLGMWMKRWESTLKGLIQDWKKNTTCNHLKMS